MNVTDYTPEYDPSVYEYHKNSPDTFWQINPRYCLTGPSAVVLASLFSAKPTIFLAPPVSQAAGSPFGFNKWVPWFKFANGVVRNAAVLSQYWGMPGVPAAQVMDFVETDIATPVEGQ